MRGDIKPAVLGPVPGPMVGNEAQLYARLSLERYELLLPQSDVRTLESILDVVTDEPLMHSVGWLLFAGEHWPIYGLDEDLQPLSELPAAQRICVLLGTEGGGFGLLCQHAVTLPSADVRICGLPPAMATAEGPLTGLAIDDNRVGLVSTAAVLATFFSPSAVYG